MPRADEIPTATIILSYAKIMASHRRAWISRKSGIFLLRNEREKKKKATEAAALGSTENRAPAAGTALFLPYCARPWLIFVRKESPACLPARRHRRVLRLALRRNRHRMAFEGAAPYARSAGARASRWAAALRLHGLYARHGDFRCDCRPGTWHHRRAMTASSGQQARRRREAQRGVMMMSESAASRLANQGTRGDLDAGMGHGVIGAVSEPSCWKEKMSTSSSIKMTRRE